MKSEKPITPDEVEHQINMPKEVFDAFNEFIVKNYSNGQSEFSRSNVKSRIKELTSEDAFNSKWLNVDNYYRDAGWKVNCHRKYGIRYYVFTPESKKMKSGKPITPNEVVEQKNTIPKEVFEAYNKLIITKYSNGIAIISYNDIISKIQELMDMDLFNRTFNCLWLNAKNHYRKAGWTVTTGKYNDELYYSFEKNNKNKFSFDRSR